MKTRIFNKLNTIIIVLILTSLISAYTIGITPIITISAIILALLVKVKKNKFDKKILVLGLILTITLLYLILPDLIYPTFRTDFHNHASVSKNLADEKVFDTILHEYPRGTQALIAGLIQISPLNFFQTTTIISILLFILTSVDLYTLSKKWIKNEKKSLTTFIIFSFNILILWNLQLGFIPSLLGFYLLINYLKNEDGNKSILNSACLATVYPHYLAILFIYIIIKNLLHKDLINIIKKITLTLLISCFEFIPLIYQQFFNQTETVLLIKGGILAPNITILLLHFLLIIPVIKRFKIKNLKKKEFLLLIPPIIMQSVIIFSIVINYLFQLTQYVTLKQFYMVIKLAYFETIPLSILISSSLKNKKVIITMSVIFILLFTSSIIYIKSNNYYNPGLYQIGDLMNELIQPNSTILLDETILNEVIINQPPFYYKSLISLSDDYSEIIRINAEKSLRTNWMTFTNNSFYYNNTRVFKYSCEADYYIGYNNTLKGEYLYNKSGLHVINLN